MLFTLRALFVVGVLFSVNAHAESSEQLIYPLGGPFEVDDGLGAARKGHSHKGVDLGAEMGTPVVSVWDGVVVKAGRSGNAGWSVRIQHPNGIVTFYAHLKAKPNVVTGEEVHQGEILGGVGETGNATYPHLHFEMREGKKVLNPKSIYGWD